MGTHTSINVDDIGETTPSDSYIVMEKSDDIGMFAFLAVY
jgi:hypothetical protein